MTRATGWKPQRGAVAFGVAGPLLQTGRVVLFGHWPTSLAVWCIAVDAYVVGALMLAGAALAARTGNHRLLAAGWGFSAGILYRSWFEQLADPTRHAGVEVLVIGVKAVLFAWAAAGFVGCVVRRGPLVAVGALDVPA